MGVGGGGAIAGTNQTEAWGALYLGDTLIREKSNIYTTRPTMHIGNSCSSKDSLPTVKDR